MGNGRGAESSPRGEVVRESAHGGSYAAGRAADGQAHDEAPFPYRACDHTSPNEVIQVHIATILALQREG